MKNSVILKIFNALDDGKRHHQDSDEAIAADEALFASLPPQLHQTVNTLIDNATKSAAEENEHYFTLGFKLGVKLGKELED